MVSIDTEAPCMWSSICIRSSLTIFSEEYRAVISPLNLLANFQWSVVVLRANRVVTGNGNFNVFEKGQTLIATLPTTLCTIPRAVYGIRVSSLRHRSDPISHWTFIFECQTLGRLMEGVSGRRNTCDSRKWTALRQTSIWRFHGLFLPIVIIGLCLLSSGSCALRQCRWSNLFILI